MNNIPSVDLADFLSEDPKRKQKFVDKIGSAYQDIGFVSLKNHFLSDDLVDALYKEVKCFFALPDLKEFWHFGQEPTPDANLSEEMPKNVIVEELPDFNHTGMEAYRMLEKTGIYVLRALALYIGLDEFYFDHWQ